MKNKIRELLQILLIVIAAILPWVVDFSGIVSKAIKDGVDVGLKEYAIITSGRYILSIVLAVIALQLVRNRNKEYVFNDTGNEYCDHEYWWFCVCSKILGYKKCSLVRVPISMQFKLLIEKTFQEYSYGNEMNYTRIDDENIVILTENGRKDIVNLVLVDTYPVPPELLPGVVGHNTTVFIKRENTDGKQYISQNFCGEVQKTVYKLVQAGCSTINVFPTTNAAHNITIVQSAFMKGGRGDVEHLYVFPQPNFSKHDWRFSDKGVKLR